MKFLLLFIGLICCIAGGLLRRNVNKKMQSKFCIILGVIIIFVNFLFLWVEIKVGIILSLITVTFVVISVGGAMKLKNSQISNKLSVGQNNILKWSIFVTIMIGPVLFGIYAAILPSVTLNNGVIHIDGSFGGNFNVSDIQSVDTASVYPKVGFMRGGSAFFVSCIGNFDVEGEQQTAKLCIYRDRPPFIRIRMKDDRLLLLNFYDSNKTMEFYNQLKNIND